jgi:formylglycine-generating enzyme required for sulfatase activity
MLTGVGRSDQPAGRAASKPTDTQPAYPLWDGKESVADYAKRAGIEDAQITLALDGNLTMKLTLIPAGKFLMGSPAGEKDREDEEGPPHEVTISKPFYVGVYTVTQAQWKAVMGTTVAQQRDRADKDSSLFGVGDDHPMYFVSWEEAVDFCKRLSQKTGRAARLPAEAEWEYACRAGSKTRFSFGDDTEYEQLTEYVWYENNSDSKTHPVGRKKPNGWGLYDMHGNVWQWCSDWAGSYGKEAQTDPTGPASGSDRVLRGGSWNNNAHHCRSAIRQGRSPDYRIHFLGFRVVVELK